MFSSKAKGEKRIYAQLYAHRTWAVTVLSALINKTVPCLVLRVFGKVLWQNWFLEVFETHFHCVGRLNTLSFPQLIVGVGVWGRGVGAKMEQPLTGGRFLAICACALRSTPRV